jgi:hypothetical protein
VRGKNARKQEDLEDLQPLQVGAVALLEFLLAAEQSLLRIRQLPTRKVIMFINPNLRGQSKK